MNGFAKGGCELNVCFTWVIPNGILVPSAPREGQEEPSREAAFDVLPKRAGGTWLQDTAAGSSSESSLCPGCADCTQERLFGCPPGQSPAVLHCVPEEMPLLEASE